MRLRLALFAVLLLAAPSFAAKPSKSDAPAAAGKIVIPPRITDIAAAGEAAYKARDAARLFEAYGQWVADGEVPLDAHSYDRLALAALKLGPVSSHANFYWNLSKNSGARTGRVVFDEWYKAARSPTEPDVELFKESLGLGEWFSAYMYGAQGDYQIYDHRSAGAIESFRKAIAIEPNCSDLRALGALGPNDAKSLKDKLVFLRRAAALGESRGQIDEKAYESLRYDDPEFLKLLASMPLEEQFRRKRSTRNDSPPIDVAASLFVGNNRQAFQQQVASMPRSAAVLYWTAMDRLQHGDTGYAEIDQLFADALAMEPAHAQCLIERVSTLRRLGRTAEAVASGETGVQAATPFLAFRAHEQLAWALLDAKRFEDAYRQADALLALRAGDARALELRVRALMGMGQWEDALYWSAPWVAIAQSAEARIVRGDLHARLGHHQLAAYSYLIAMQDDPSTLASCYPRWSAAVETYRAEHCATAPTNLLETLRHNRLLVRAAGDPRALHSAWGLVSRWERDGRLRITDRYDNGILLAADGVGYTAIMDDALVGQVMQPRELGDGRRQYPMRQKTLVWAPDGSVYFGSPDLFAPAWDGSWFDCTGVSWRGPFLGYRSAQFVEVLAESTYKEMRDGREWVTRRTRLTGGLVDMVVKGYVDSTPTEFRSLDLGEGGTFHGSFLSNRAPRKGLLVQRDGKRAIVHETQVLKVVPKGEEAWAWPGGNTGESYKYLANDVLEYRDRSGAIIQNVVRYLPDGSPPQVSNEKQVWIRGSAEPEVTEPVSTQEDIGASLGGTRALRTCYRCKGTGMIWISGGASQTSLSTPSYLFGSQAESWRNSSASIGTVYTSGHMGTCPVCKGEGGW